MDSSVPVVVYVFGLALDRTVVIALIPGLLGLIGIGLTLYFTNRREAARDRVRHAHEKGERDDERGREASQRALVVATELSASVSQRDFVGPDHVQLPAAELSKLEIAALQIVDREVRDAVRAVATALAWTGALADLGRLGGSSWIIQSTLLSSAIEILAAALRGDDLPKESLDYVAEADRAKTAWFDALRNRPKDDVQDA